MKNFIVRVLLTAVTTCVVLLSLKVDATSIPFTCPSNYLYPQIRAIPGVGSEYKVNSVEFSEKLQILVMGGMVKYPEHVEYAVDYINGVEQGSDLPVDSDGFKRA